MFTIFTYIMVKHQKPCMMHLIGP